jgi:hypothetical protein
MVGLKALNVSGASYWELVLWPRLGYPFRMFLVLSDSTIASTILREYEETPCLFDTWSSDFISTHGKDLLDVASLAFVELRLLAHTVKEDIAQIEARHASVRRFVMARSLQSPGVHLEEVSCHFIATKLRGRWAELRRMHGFSSTFNTSRRSDQQATAPSTKKAKTRGAGGAWRAFVHSVSWGEFADFRVLGERFRALAPEDRERFAALGDLGTQRAQEGLPAFGPAPWRLRRKLKRERAIPSLAIADASCRAAVYGTPEELAPISGNDPIISVSVACVKATVHHIRRLKSTDEHSSSLILRLLGRCCCRMHRRSVPPLIRCMLTLCCLCTSDSCARQRIPFGLLLRTLIHLAPVHTQPIENWRKLVFGRMP